MNDPASHQHSCCSGHDHGDVQPSAVAKYFCPMCPGVESDVPGDCPKCGMPLERNPAWAGGGDEEDDGELRDMLLRLRIGALLTLPVFAVAMLHFIPALAHPVDNDAMRWMQFALSTPVVLWAGAPFFRRG